MGQPSSPNISRLVIRYVSDHPSVKDCLRRGIINYSALAREVCTHFGIDKFDAAVIALRRLHRRTKGSESREKRIMQLIRRAKVRVRTKIMVAIATKPRDFEKVYRLQREIRLAGGDFNLIEGEDTVTIITNDEHGPELRLLFRTSLRKLSTKLVQIALLFDKELETTSGVVAHVYGLLADSGVNVLEEMSCWTDVMIVIEQRDLTKAMKALGLDDD
jgi:hypothetical protein